MTITQYGLILLHMFAAGVAGYTLIRLGKVFFDIEPSSRSKILEGFVLAGIVGILCIVNVFFWVPDAQNVDYAGQVIGVTAITLLVSFYLLRSYIPDLRFKYNFNLIVFKNPNSPMEQVGQLVSFAECEEMIARFRKNNPDAKENYFYDVDFVKQVIGTEGAKKLLLVEGETTEGEKTIILFPATDNLERIPMKKTGNIMRALNDEDDDDSEYGGDRAGTTPPGKG